MSSKDCKMNKDYVAGAGAKGHLECYVPLLHYFDPKEKNLKLISVRYKFLFTQLQTI